MRRREFLRGAGAVTVLVAGGAVWRAYDRGVFGAGEGPAYEPWKNWRSDRSEGPLALVRAAILAASAANSQPWLFRVAGSGIELRADGSRNTGAFDPYMRELSISLGCALENLMLAAAAGGYAASLELFPAALGPIPASPREELVARVGLQPGRREKSPLYDAIPHRHTNRFPFDAARPLPQDFLDALGRVGESEPDLRVFLFENDEERARIVSMMSEAAKALGADTAFRSAMARWIRPDSKSIRERRDGLTYGEFGESPLLAAAEKFFPAPILARIVPPPSKDPYASVLATGRVFGLIAVRDRYERSQSVRAGRCWQRAHLLATAHGLAARPANQTVELIDQERFHGRPPREAAVLAELTGDASWQPTFMFFAGHPTRPAPATARRPVADVVLRGGPTGGGAASL